MQKRRHAARLAQLGASPIQVPYRLPFGFDILWDAISVCVSLRRSYINSITIEMRTLNFSESTRN